MTTLEKVVLRADDYSVETIPYGMGVELVAAHHYARGASNTAVYRHGLFRRENPLECLGAALWIPPIRRAAESVSDDWMGVLVLSRLVVAPEVPHNGASFLLGRSIRLIRGERRFHTLITYADEGQGHRGGIYRATNWEYLGARKTRETWIDAAGRMVSQKSGSRTRTVSDMEALGYRRIGNSVKHKFVMRLR